MAKIKIKNLSKNVKISAKEMGYIVGGGAGDLSHDMLEMQSAFYLQYLMLQKKISHENRQFSMISNIMKTKQDTARNAINNIR